MAVSIRARTSQFQKGLRKARRQVITFAKSVKRAATGLVGFGAAITGAAAGGGLAILTKQSFKSIDAVGKLADRIGDSTEAIVKLQHAADITGAGADLMARSLDVMSKRLGEAAGGTGEAKDAIEKLGLNVDELIRMRPSEAFIEIAEAIRKLDTQAEKASVVSDLFSRAGLRLLNTLELGKRGLAKMGLEAEKLGLTYSNTQSQLVQAANDAVSNLGGAFRGIANQIAIHLADPLRRAADRMRDLITEGGALRNKFQNIMPTIEALWDKLAAAVQKVIDLIRELIDLLRDLPIKVKLYVGSAIHSFELFAQMLRALFPPLKKMVEGPKWVGRKLMKEAEEELRREQERRAVEAVRKRAEQRQGAQRAAAQAGAVAGAKGAAAGAKAQAQAVADAVSEAAEAYLRKPATLLERAKAWKEAGGKVQPGMRADETTAEYRARRRQEVEYERVLRAERIKETRQRRRLKERGIEMAEGEERFPMEDRIRRALEWFRGGGRPDPRMRKGESQEDWRERRRREVQMLDVLRQAGIILKNIEKNTSRSASGAAYQ